MNPNALALAATITVATAAGIVNRFRTSTPSASSQRTNLTRAQAIHVLMNELERQLEINKALTFQNDYLSNMLDANDITADEFDRIVMNYPITAKK